MEYTINTTENLVGRTYGKRRLGVPNCAWEHHNKYDLEVLYEYVKRTDLGPGKARLRVIITMMMNLRRL
jgi:hypothetical protein